MSNGLDFEKVDLVREALGLSVANMSRLLDVSRATYYKWRGGSPIRERNIQRIKQVLKHVLPLIKTGVWPPQNIRDMAHDERYEALLEVLRAPV